MILTEYVYRIMRHCTQNSGRVVGIAVFQRERERERERTLGNPSRVSVSKVTEQLSAPPL